MSETPCKKWSSVSGVLAPLFLGLALCATPSIAAETSSASEPKVETGFAEVNGTRLYYEIAGTGDPIVLIHGNFGDRRYFDGQFDVLARDHRVLRYDIRGYGKSMLPDEGVPYSDFEDLEALMAHLDIDRAHIAGFSLGSGTAVDFCLAYPDPRRVLTPPAAEQLEKITVPALIITAEYDLDACRAVAQQMDTRIPDSTMVDLASATHFMFMEEPEQVNAAMLDFLVEASSR